MNINDIIGEYIGNGLGTEIKCPICSDNYIHFSDDPYTNDSNETRFIEFFGECGSRFAIGLNFHKGQMSCWARVYESCKEKSLIESPIEQIFWDCAMVRIYGIVPQYKIENYRVDFAVPDKKVAIELDGHDYHKTKEQRTNDAERERNLELLGWKVIRFTGSEVFKDTEGCVNQVNQLIEVWSNKK